MTSAARRTARTSRRTTRATASTAALGNQVAGGSTVRFFDAEKLETWLAQNSLGYLGFDLGPKGGANLGPGKKPGYTIFVLNTWDSPQAQAILARSTSTTR